MSPKEPTPSSIRPGLLFCDRYRIEEKAAEGGMATIYLATDESSGLPVAIKVLFGRYSDNETVRARFIDEGRIQAMLQHPNIVHVYRVITDPVLCFVMEYIEGETLEEYLTREEVLDEAEIVDLVMPVMSAVGFAHSKGIVHRDLKPSNVLLDESTGFIEPKVMDFGVAKVSRGKELTAAGTTVGTLHYMSPEQIVGAKDIDGRADIYSLGCSLYKLCTGEVPFNASSEFALMMAQVEAPPTPPSELRSELSSEMEALILRALKKEPEHRFQTIKEMTSALMKLGEPKQDRDTITRPIPADLLEHAMGADEVALDRSDHFRIEGLTAEMDEASELASMTHELSSTAIQRIENDRLRAARRKTSGSLPMEDIETVERKRPDTGSNPTSEQSLDELTTRPQTEAAASAASDPSMATTTERKPPIFEERKTTEQPAEDRKTIPIDSGPIESIADSGNRGIIAVDNTGVDSKEVTDLLQRDNIEFRKTTEQPSTRRRSSSSDGDSADESSPSNGRELTAATAAERPALRNAPGSSPSGDDSTPDASSSGAQLVVESDPTDPTPGERPAARREQFQNLDSGPVQQRAKPPAARTSSSLGSANAEPETARSRRDKSSSPQSGVIWLIIGVSALLVAIAVLVWALFFAG